MKPPSARNAVPGGIVTVYVRTLSGRNMGTSSASVVEGDRSFKLNKRELQEEKMKAIQVRSCNYSQFLSLIEHVRN